MKGLIRVAAALTLSAGVAVFTHAPGHAQGAGPDAAGAVVLKRSGARCQADPNCFNRLHPAIPMVARARPGQLIVFETRDAADTDFNLDTEFPRDLGLADSNAVHPLSGPVHIEGAKRGDVLAITLIDIEPAEYGFTEILPIGFLADLFPGPPVIANWRLNRTEAVSAQIPGVRIPYAAFPGIVTVLPGPQEAEAMRDREMRLLAAGGKVAPPQPESAAPAELCGPEGRYRDECLRTIPPREHGGNMDIQYLQAGVTVLLPCFVDGCGLAVGDVHYAQGDGEVSGTAIEMAATVTVRTEIRKGLGRVIRHPQYEGTTQLRDLAPARFYATTGIPLKVAGETPAYSGYLGSSRAKELSNLSQNLTLAARNALLDMLDYMVREHGLTREQAYMVASVAVDLRIGQVVDSPNFGVTAILPLEIFDQ